MEIRNPLITSRVAGRAAYMPLPHGLPSGIPEGGFSTQGSLGISSVYAAQDAWARWRPGDLTVEAIATSRGTVLPLTSPQAYQGALQVKTLRQYAWQSARWSKADLVDQQGKGFIIAAFTCLVSALVLPSSLGAIILGEAVLIMALSFIPYRRIRHTLQRLRHERPLLEHEVASLQEACSLLPSSPLAPLYDAWHGASDEDIRRRVEEIWKKAIAQEEERLRREQTVERQAFQEALLEDPLAAARQERKDLEARRLLEKQETLKALEEVALTFAAPLPLLGDPQESSAALQDQVRS